MHQEVIFKGRPGNNIFYPRMLVAGNAWGGILVGNFCSPANERGPPIEPKVLVSWTEFSDNMYHPHMEIFACQQFGNPKMHIDISGVLCKLRTNYLCSSPAEHSDWWHWNGLSHGTLCEYRVGAEQQSLPWHFQHGTAHQERQTPSIGGTARKSIDGELAVLRRNFLQGGHSQK